MSDGMFFDDPMVCTADDPDPFGTEETGVWETPNEGGIGPGADETGIWELPDEGGIGPGPDETGIWELPDSPSVEVDWDEVDPGTEVVDPPTNPGFDPEPTVPDAEAPVFPEVEGGETAVEGAEAGEAAVEGVEAGEVAVEAAEGLELIDVLEVGALLLL